MVDGNGGNAPRKLNMDEKRKLEKMLFEDINGALSQYKAKRQKEEEQLKQSLLEKVPKEVAAAFKKYTDANDDMKKAEKELLALGFNVSNYGKGSLSIGYGKAPKELEAFRNETAKKQLAITNLKRSYTIRLFGGGELAQELFETLQKELADILK